ncbi:MULTISPECIES: AzlD domain-containing protein [Listeria]|uniref:AzlD domain-containing protein n=1 Tax=Listeria TaxID=1637 RepID=UPI000B5959B7|nr:MULTISPECIES: AzlD domain-containing protein [Listeria]
MAISTYTFLAIIGCAIVTFIPRVLPFLFVRKMKLPDLLMSYLSYVPLCILTALFIQSLLTEHDGNFPSIDLLPFLAALPTILTAILTKNLLWVVVIGIISMAALRFFF